MLGGVGHLSLLVDLSICAAHLVRVAAPRLRPDPVGKPRGGVRTAEKRLIPACGRAGRLLKGRARRGSKANRRGMRRPRRSGRSRALEPSLQLARWSWAAGRTSDRQHNTGLASERGEESCPTRGSEAASHPSISISTACPDIARTSSRALRSRSSARGTTRRVGSAVRLAAVASEDKPCRAARDV